MNRITALGAPGGSRDDLDVHRWAREVREARAPGRRDRRSAADASVRRAADGGSRARGARWNGSRVLPVLLEFLDVPRTAWTLPGRSVRPRARARARRGPQAARAPRAAGDRSRLGSHGVGRARLE